MISKMRLFKRRNSEPSNTDALDTISSTKIKTPTNTHITPSTTPTESPKSSRKGFPVWGKKLGHQIGKLKKGDSNEKLQNVPENAKKRFRSTIENLQLTEAQLKNYLNMCQPYDSSHIQDNENIDSNLNERFTLDSTLTDYETKSCIYSSSKEYEVNENNLKTILTAEEKNTVTVPTPLKEKQRSFTKLKRFFSKSPKDDDKGTMGKKVIVNEKNNSKKHSFPRALSLNEISAVINNIMNSEESGYSSTSARNSSGSEESSSYVANLKNFELCTAPVPNQINKEYVQAILKSSTLQKEVQSLSHHSSTKRNSIISTKTVLPKKNQPRAVSSNKDVTQTTSIKNKHRLTTAQSSFHRQLPKPIMISGSDINSKQTSFKNVEDFSTSSPEIQETKGKVLRFSANPRSVDVIQITNPTLGSLDRSLLKKHSPQNKNKINFVNSPSVKRTRSTCEEDNVIVSLAKKRNTILKDMGKETVSLTDMKNLNEIDGMSNQSYLTVGRNEEICNRLFEKEYKVVHLHVNGTDTAGIIVDAQQRGNPSTPFVISYITPGSPAERCGSLWIGDEVVKVNGARLRGSLPVLAKRVFIPDRNGNLEIVICRMRASRQETLDSAAPVSLSQLNQKPPIPDIDFIDNQSCNFIVPRMGSNEFRLDELKTQKIITNLVDKKTITPNERETSVDSALDEHSCFIMPKFVPDREETKNDVDEKKFTGMRKFTVQKDVNSHKCHTLGKRRSVSFQATVCYRKGRGYKPLGIVVVGGKDAIRGPMGIYVKRIEHDGQAAEDGTLREGDEILNVNGTTVQGLKLSDAIQLIRNVKNGPVLLQISTKRSPESTNLLSMRADSF